MININYVGIIFLNSRRYFFFKYIHDKGFAGVMGMEHGNKHPGKEGEAAVLAAYRDVDNL